MLKRIIFPVFLFLFITSGISNTAVAKKGIAFLNYKTESIVKVIDLPDISPLKSKNGNYIDLGYKFNPTGGDWVGYIGSDDKYIKLDQRTLQAMLTIAGLKKPPPVPARPAGSKLDVFLFLVGVAIAAFMALLYLIFLVMKVVRFRDRQKQAASPFSGPVGNVIQRPAQSGNNSATTGFGSVRPAARPARASFGKR